MRESFFFRQIDYRAHNAIALVMSDEGSKFKSGIIKSVVSNKKILSKCSRGLVKQD